MERSWRSASTYLSAISSSARHISHLLEIARDTPVELLRVGMTQSRPHLTRYSPEQRGGCEEGRPVLFAARPHPCRLELRPGLGRKVSLEASPHDSRLP